MRVSLFVGLGVLALKITAYVLSHSQALLADVAESVVHQLAVGVATYLAYLQLKPADRNHPHGHGKFGFISSGLEGSLILVTGLVILLSSLTHLLHPAAVGQPNSRRDLREWLQHEPATVHSRMGHR
ncbi:MAG: cation transporter [Opitutales bacterium]|nr:cation transporter [Opitutales bacterium]